MPWHSVTVPVSPPEGHRGACAPPAPTARSRRGGSAQAVLVLLTNNSVSLCRGLVPGSSGGSSWDNKSQLVHSRGVSLPSRSPVLRPLARVLQPPWGCRGPGVTPCRRVSPTLPGHRRAVGARRAFGTSSRLYGVGSSRQRLGDFKPSWFFLPVCAGMWGPGGQSPAGARAAAGIRESRGAAALVGEQECSFSRDFPVKTCRKGMVQLSAASWSHQHLHLIAHR